MSDIVERIQRETERRTGVVRDMLKDHPQQLAEFDASMEDLDSGDYHRRVVWNALTEPQRRLMVVLDGGRRSLVRSRASRHRYDAHGEPHAIGDVASRATVAALVRRRLLRWCGGDDETLRAEVAEEGRKLQATKLKTN